MATKKTPYRNVIRSKKLIQDALLQLMKKKDIVKIRTCEVIELANISKGTYYAHYTCLNDVRQEIEEQQLALMFKVFDQHPPELLLENLYPLFICGLSEMEKNRELYQILFHDSYGDSFINKVKKTFLDYLLSCDPKNSSQMKSCLTYVAGGAIAVIQDWLENEPDVPAENIARFLNGCAIYGIEGSRGSN